MIEGNTYPEDINTELTTLKLQLTLIDWQVAVKQVLVPHIPSLVQPAV